MPLPIILVVVSLWWPTQAHSSGAEEPADAVVWLGRFDVEQGTSIPEPWQVVRLDEDVPATEYRLRSWDAVAAIEALADDSMALLARPASIDLNRTPVLCWRWRIDHVVSAADMKSKRGDDYAARVYVAFQLPRESMGLATRLSLRAARRLFGSAVPDAALNYVWDNRYPVGTALPNAYTERTRMIVVQTGNARRDQWIWEQRDVAADFAAHFGAHTPTLASVAIATDTDNTHTKARAGFADIHFVPRGAACATGPAAP